MLGNAMCLIKLTRKQTRPRGLTDAINETFEESYAMISLLKAEGVMFQVSDL